MGGEPAKVSGASSAPGEADCQRENTPALSPLWGRQRDPVRIPLGKHNDPNRAPQSTPGHDRRQRLCGHLSSVLLNQTTHCLPERVKSLHLLVQALHYSLVLNAETLNCSKTHPKQALHRNSIEIFFLHMLCYPQLARKK